MNSEPFSLETFVDIIGIMREGADMAFVSHPQQVIEVMQYFGFTDFNQLSFENDRQNKHSLKNHKVKVPGPLCQMIAVKDYLLKTHFPDMEGQSKWSQLQAMEKVELKILIYQRKRAGCEPAEGIELPMSPEIGAALQVSFENQLNIHETISDFMAHRRVLTADAIARAETALHAMPVDTRDQAQYRQARHASLKAQKILAHVAEIMRFGYVGPQYSNLQRVIGGGVRPPAPGM